MTIEPWHYDTAEDLDQTMVERLRNFPREPDLLVYSARLIVAAVIRGWLRVYHRLQIVGRRESARERLVRAGGQPLQPSGRLDDPLGDAARQAASRVSRRRPGFLLRQRSAAGRGGHRGQRLALQSPGNIRQSLSLCRQLLENPGNVLLLFPEGTRSTTGELGEFKPGIGLMLAGTHVPVVPCYLDGTFRAWPKGTWFPRPRRVRLVIGQPRTYEHLGRGKDSALEISRDLREAILALASTLSPASTPSRGIDIHRRPDERIARSQPMPVPISSLPNIR